jgi:hypothetical protein
MRNKDLSHISRRMRNGSYCKISHYILFVAGKEAAFIPRVRADFRACIVGPFD